MSTHFTEPHPVTARDPVLRAAQSPAAAATADADDARTDVMQREGGG